VKLLRQRAKTAENLSAVLEPWKAWIEDIMTRPSFQITGMQEHCNLIRSYQAPLRVTDKAPRGTQHPCVALCIGQVQPQSLQLGCSSIEYWVIVVDHLQHQYEQIANHPRSQLTQG
jgi:hypothetical protein